MMYPKFNPVDNRENLKERIEDFFRNKTKQKPKKNLRQLSLSFEEQSNSKELFETPSQNIVSFLDFVCAAVPLGDVYLFGGIIRDLALFGRKGFNSDVDLVVEGEWSSLIPYIESLGAEKNKFGGYRFYLDRLPVDIWQAKETWAFKEGLVEYKGIGSLPKTTVLNWDAILMDWRTRQFICQPEYFEDIKNRKLDVVLEQNPNPLGMAVRVFRHLWMKDAEKISVSAVKYLARTAKTFSFDEINQAEINSYGNAVIERLAHSFFEHIDVSEERMIEVRYGIASEIMTKELRFN